MLIYVDVDSLWLTYKHNLPRKTKEGPFGLSQMLHKNPVRGEHSLIKVQWWFSPVPQTTTVENEKTIQRNAPVPAKLGTIWKFGASIRQGIGKIGTLRKSISYLYYYNITISKYDEDEDFPQQKSYTLKRNLETRGPGSPLWAKNSWPALSAISTTMKVPTTSGGRGPGSWLDCEPNKNQQKITMGWKLQL